MESYSIWLTPNQIDKAYLSDVIRKLAQKYDAPVFSPHCTLYGRVKMPVEEIIPIVESATKGITPFSVEVEQLNYSEVIWKTVFMELKMNSNLKAINRQLTRSFQHRFPYEFKPHISLIYKLLRENEKKAIIDRLNLKTTYQMESIEVVRSSDCVERWEPVFTIHWS